jgi:hypothetical protein
MAMGDHLRSSAFKRPASVDYASRVDRWVLGANYQFGTCGPVSVANLALLVSTVLGHQTLRFTDEEVFDLYRRSGNPGFDPATGADDNGVIMTVMLSELVKGGIGFGPRNVKALAFGRLNARDPEEMWAAAALFGGVLVGADLDQAQADQFERGRTWDHAEGTPDWGGHAMLAAPRYTDVEGTLADRTALVTWAQVTDMTEAFIRRQVPEVYAVIFPWHVRDRGFVDGINLQGVAREYESLTGRPFPALPAPGPAPHVDPAPPAQLADLPLEDLRKWAAKPLGRNQSKKAAALFLDWAKRHNLT